MVCHRIGVGERRGSRRGRPRRAWHGADAGIEEVDAQPRLARLAGIGAHHHLEGGLARRVGAPIGKDAEPAPEVTKMARPASDWRRAGPCCG